MQSTQGHSHLSGVPRQHPAKLFFESRGSYATTLVVLLIDLLGTQENALEPLTWAPDTIRLEVYRLTGAKLPDCNLDRIMALASVLLAEADPELSFYRSPSRFLQVCNVLSGDEFDPDVFDWADSYEVAWGITEVALNDPPAQDDEEPFSPEVRHYIGFALDQDGIVNPPDILQLALRDHDPAAIASEFSDDPDMFGALYEAQEARTADILESLQGGLLELKRQLEALPLTHGKVDGLFKNLRLLQEVNHNELSELNAPAH